MNLLPLFGLVCLAMPPVGQNPYQNGPDNPYTPVAPQAPDRPRDPPLSAIWSGDAPNARLKELKDLLKRGQALPRTTIDAKVLRAINLAKGEKNLSDSLFRQPDKLPWPAVLKGPEFESARKRFDKHFAGAAKAVREGAAPMEIGTELKQAAEDLRKALLEQAGDLGPNEYIQGKRFLNQLEQALKGLQDPALKQLLVLHDKLARCKTAAELVAFLAEEDLHFGPALPDQRAAYEDLYRILKGTTPPPKK